LRFKEFRGKIKDRSVKEIVGSVKSSPDNLS